MLIVGQKEQDAGAVAVRVHGQGDRGVKPQAEVIAELLQAIKERKP
jgi:threonyl-tRNA synthetase